jgi:hypothetical protein
MGWILEESSPKTSAWTRRPLTAKEWSGDWSQDLEAAYGGGAMM